MARWADLRHSLDLRRSLPDLIGLAGAAALLYGIALISGPAAWIVGGLLAIALSCLAAARERRPAPGSAT